MNLKYILIGLTVTCTFYITAVNAQIIQCKNAEGKLVFTDNISNCANKNISKKIEQKKQSENFYNEIPDLLQTLNIAGFAGDG